MSRVRVVASFAFGVALWLATGCAPWPPHVIPQAETPPCTPGELTAGGLVETPYGRRFVFVGCRTTP